MFERFTDRARRVVVLALEEARLLGHDHIGTEHLLLGLSHAGGSAAEALEAVDVSLAVLRERLVEVVGRGDDAPSGHMPFTSHAKHALELSLRASREQNDNFIATGHLLLGVVQERDGVAIQVLRGLGVDLARLRVLVLEAIATADESATAGGLPSIDLGRQSSGLLAPSASFGPSGSLPDVCGFCGRRLWDFDRYVRGPRSVMCDRCLATASELNRPGFDGGSGYWIPTVSLVFASKA